MTKITIPGLNVKIITKNATKMSGDNVSSTLYIMYKVDIYIQCTLLPYIHQLAPFSQL